jgi:hypothetical protein
MVAVSPAWHLAREVRVLTAGAFHAQRYPSQGSTGRCQSDRVAPAPSCTAKLGPDKLGCGYQIRTGDLRLMRPTGTTRLPQPALNSCRPHPRGTPTYQCGLTADPRTTFRLYRRFVALSGNFKERGFLLSGFTDTQQTRRRPGGTPLPFSVDGDRRHLGSDPVGIPSTTRHPPASAERWRVILARGRRPIGDTRPAGHASTAY